MGIFFSQVLTNCLATLIETGGIAKRLGPTEKGKPPKTLTPGIPRETREFNGKTYNMEHALPGDVAIFRAAKVDEAGNCVFRYVYLNHNELHARLTCCPH